MEYKKKGYNRLLVGDLYSWGVVDTGEIMVRRNEEVAELSGG